MKRLKNDRVLESGKLMSAVVAQDIKGNLDDYPFSDYFGESTMLVPVPKSSIPQRGDLWVPQRITSALASNGLGVNGECLIRDKPLQKSSKASAANRPKAFEHYKSMKVKELLPDPKKIVLYW